MRRFIAELRRRNVFRIAAAYSLSAWILIEAGSVLLPVFGAGESLFRAYVMVVIAGFAVAVALAWRFEWTPEGVKLDRRVAADAPVQAEPRGQKLNYAIIALLVLALAVSVTFNVLELDTPDGGPGVARRSIAVLPFDSLGSDGENRSFVDGIHDDLLNRLASIQSLKVISRTSVMEYRDTTRNVREIGEELGVESLLEGSVQRAGDHVRINLQLIDAGTDERIWGDSYDRLLSIENIFTIQREISEAVAAALETTLSPEEQASVEATPTSDLRAFRLFREGKQNIYLRRLDTLRKAREQFEEAIALDPAYAQAYAGLAESVLLLWNNHNDLPEAAAVRLTETNLARALELDPRLADAWAIRGLLQSTLWLNDRSGSENVEAETAFRRAIELNANHASAYMWFAALRDNEERLGEAIELYQRAMELDPLARIPYVNLPLIYAKRGEHHAAMQLWLEGARVHSDWPTIYEYVANHLWGMGRLVEAFAWDRKAAELAPGALDSPLRGFAIMLDLGDVERAEALLDAVPREHPLAAMTQAFRAMVEGDYREAMTLFAGYADRGIGPAKGFYTAASDAAILAGDLDQARKYVLLAHPSLAGDAAGAVDRQTLDSAVKLAWIALREGRRQEAASLLETSLALVRRLPRLGTFGYGIRDVQIYALLGRKEDALQAFRAALDEGFRGSIFFDNWPLALDPYIASLRDEPRFVAMVAELDRDLAEMREQLAAAQAAGDLDALRMRAETI
ncbi:MAG TPA: hypothetical protein VF200_15155 [Woeseiaceae bacterium]